PSRATGPARPRCSHEGDRRLDGAARGGQYRYGPAALTVRAGRSPLGGPAMNFDFSPDQKALRDQARKFLAQPASSTPVPPIPDTDTPYEAELWPGMAEMGWTGTAIPESYGGAGFGYLELCVLAEELGRSVAPAPFASTVYLAAEALLLAGSEAQKRRWLPRV